MDGSTIFGQRLHEILHQTKLDVKKRKKHLIYVHQRILRAAVFARNKSASRPPVFPLAMLGYSSTIPETEKTTVFVKPAHIPIRRPMTLRSPHRLHWYTLYLRASKRSSILSLGSIRWTECAMGMLGCLFPLCRRTPLILRLEESMKRLWRIMWQTKGRKQARYVCAVAQLVFHVKKGSRVFVPIPETGDPYIFLD